MRKILIFNAVLILLTSCSSHNGILRESMPAKRTVIDVRKDGTMVLRNIYSDIYLKKLGPEDWKQISESPALTREKNGVRVYRIPRKFFFRAVVKNTWKVPVKISDIKIRYANKTLSEISITKLKKDLKSPAYSIFRIEEIFTPRRLLIDPEEIKNLSYENDTIKYTLDFITPGEAVMVICAFDWIPVEQRKYSVIFTIRAKEAKKIIDFELTRFEYRTRGKYYLKPAKDALDEI